MISTSSTAQRNDSTRASSLKKKLRSTTESDESRTRSRFETNAALERAVLLCLGEKPLSIRAAAREARVSRDALGQRLRRLRGQITPQPKRAISEEEVPGLVKLLDKRTEAHVAQRRGVSVKTLRRTLRRAGVPKRRPGRPKTSKAMAMRDRRADSETQEIWKAYQRGSSCAQVGEAFGLSASGVSRRLGAAGYRLRKAGRPAGGVEEC